MTKIGILGGSFNPVHLGHLLIAQTAWEELGLDRVKFIPAAQPPHKRAASLAAAEHRVAMLRRAIRGHPAFELDCIELRRGGPSYAVDTLRALRRRHPQAQFYFIVGTDTLPELPTWRAADELAKLCVFVAVSRPGYRPRVPRAPGGRRFRYRLLTGHPCAVSATDIRARIASGRSIRYLVPEAVERYIRQHRLYV